MSAYECYLKNSFRQGVKPLRSSSLTLARLQVISSCCLLLAQYALLLVFGVYGPELLDASGANKLYACASWGACFLAAPAGLCFDILGPAWPPGHTWLVP